MKEEDIIARLRDGDSQAMEALMQQYGPFLRYILTPILLNASEREECFSEVIARIWQKQAQYDPGKGSWKAWVAAIARNTALNWNRTRKQTEPLSEEIPADTMAPEDILLRKERQKALEQALLQVSRQERLLFYRKYYYLQSTAQIARELGMTERAVEGKLYRLKKKLRNLLGEDTV